VPEEKCLGETLGQIKSASDVLTQFGWETELIVCDNNSNDRTGEIARAAGATVVFEPVNQIARARNYGASVATGDWMVFIDADSHPDTGLFDCLPTLLQRSNPATASLAARPFAGTTRPFSSP